MAWTPASLQTRFPAALGALSTATGGPLDAAITEAYATAPNAATMGAVYETAVGYLAAHLALLDRRGSSDGISSATADGVSTSFDHSSEANTFWEAYERLVNRKSFGRGLSISNLVAL